MVTVFGRAILGQAGPELLKQVVSVFVAARSRILILSQAVTVFDPIQHTRGKMPTCATGFVIRRGEFTFCLAFPTDRLHAFGDGGCRSLGVGDQ